MLKKKSEEETEGWRPSASEANNLREDLKRFSAKEVNGRKQYPFELYLESRGIISFGPEGGIQVISPREFYRFNEIDSLREWQDKKDREKLFAAFPEEREKHYAWLSEMWAGIREHMRSIAVQAKV